MGELMGGDTPTLLCNGKLRGENTAKGKHKHKDKHKDNYWVRIHQLYTAMGSWKEKSAKLTRCRTLTGGFQSPYIQNPYHKGFWIGVKGFWLSLCHSVGIMNCILLTLRIMTDPFWAGGDTLYIFIRNVSHCRGEVELGFIMFHHERYSQTRS